MSETSSRRLGRVVLGVLLATVFAQAWLSLRTKSLTFDEVVYIPTGYAYLVTGDYRLNPEHPPLAKLLAGAAIAPLRPRLDTSHPAWSTPDQWAFGRDFFETAGVPTERLVSAARLPTVLLTMLLVLGAYGLARELYGPLAGLVAAWLTSFSPTLLAHGRLATNDLALTCFVVCTCLAGLRLARRPSLRRLVLTGLALGLALLSKFTAVLLVGLVAIWAAAWARRVPALEPPPPATASPWTPEPPRGTLAALGFTAVLAIGLGVVTLGYRSPGRIGPYLEGLSVLYTNVVADIPTYFNGSFHQGGLSYYFVAAFLLKTPTAFLALLALRVVHHVRSRRLDPDTVLYVLAPVVLWFTVITVSALQFGVRYVLPAYPLLFVYASGLMSAPRATPRWARTAVGALLVLFAAASLRAHPHYLPYFNVLGGGPARGIEWLDDSNIDWGQDLPLLADYLEARGTSDAVLAPMAWYDPALYGVRGSVVEPAEMLRLLADPAAPAGTYAASAHILTRGRYSGRSTFDPLRDLEPAAVLGHSIYVFER